MKKAQNRWSAFNAALAKIHLVDKFLIIFMIILLLQSAYNLFVYESASAETNSIDIIVRTSTAAIFGYFLSTNFIRHASSPPDSSISAIGKDSSPVNNTSGITNRIGFANPDSEADHALVTGSASVSKRSEDDPGEIAMASRLQIIVAAGIGLFCLVILIIIRNLIGTGGDMSVSASSTSTVAQFRDIVSGCIGFLIGCPTANSGGGNRTP